MTTTFRQSRTAPRPRSFQGLVKLHPLRPIHDDTELDNAGEMIELLAGHELNADQEDYLEALSVLIEAYEARRHHIDLSAYRGIPALKALMRDQGMNQQDLAGLLGVHKGHVSKIINGERELSKANIRALCKRFKVSADLFLG